MQHFPGMRLDRLPDKTTILKFGHFLERHVRRKALFKEVNKNLQKNGLRRREGSIVDPSIISPPSSTKNESGKRKPKMYPTRKANQWYFGMTMHIDIDDTLGLIDSIDTKAANLHDVMPGSKLCLSDEQRVFGDTGYLGIQKRVEHKVRKTVSWFIARHPGSRERLDDRKLKAEKL